MVRRHGQTLPDPDDCPEKLFKLYSLRSGISSARKCNPWIRIFENFDHDHADNFAALLFAQCFLSLFYFIYLIIFSFSLPMPFIQLPAPGAIQMMMMP
jgi:hypothetical protein